MTDTGYAAKRWEFDAEVTRVFDDMLERSIPQYEVMRETVTRLADEYAVDGTSVVDIGCSRGGAIADLVQRRPSLEYVGLEASKPMADAARERFAGRSNVSILDWDLRNGLPAYRVPATVVLSVLTLQFTPIERRQQILRACRNALWDGGALLIVEKVLGAGADIDDVMVKVYHERKVTNGYSWDDVERKRRSLEGVLVPVTAEWNERMLRDAGFRHVDCFWRWMNFAGWVAVR